MSSSIPGHVRLKVHHVLKFERVGINRMRDTSYETTYIAERPSSGHSDVVIKCKYCEHPYAYRLLDRAQTQRLRMRSAGTALAWSVGLAALLAVLFTGVFGDSFPVFLVGFLAGAGLLVAVISIFAGYFSELGVSNVNPEVLGIPKRKVRDTDQAEGSCYAMTEPAG